MPKTERSVWSPVRLIGRSLYSSLAPDLQIKKLYIGLVRIQVVGTVLYVFYLCIALPACPQRGEQPRDH